MVKKRLSWIKKFLGNIGKRIYWKFTKKMNLCLLSLLQKEVFLKYAEIHKSQKMALEILTNQVIEGSKFVLKNQFSMMKPFISESLDDFIYLSKLNSYALLGSDYKEISELKYISRAESEDGIPKIITKYKKCLSCAVIDDEIQVAELGGLNYGSILGIALTTLTQMILDYISSEYIVESKETKCFLRGDSIGESVILFKHKK